MESKAIEQCSMGNVEPRTVVVGIGGAGCNIVSDVYWADGSVDTVAINTDRAALSKTKADKKLYICKGVTEGRGTNGDNRVGRKCAKIHSDEIESAISGYDTVFIVAGMGGGTGSGVAPVVADIAQRLNAMTFAILIKPFSFESARVGTATEGIMQTKAVCRMTFVIENDVVFEKVPEVSLDKAFKMMNMRICDLVSEQRNRITAAFSDQLLKIGELISDTYASNVEVRMSNMTDCDFIS